MISSPASTSASASNAPPPPLPPPSSLVTTITPATLSSFAIYNPSLGPTDETVHDQIVFYTSRKGNAVTSNEKLRQIGLAQGIVEFARGFSKNENLSSIETQKSRIVTLEIEETGWWILAQIDLTYIHNPSSYPPTIEYSSREVSPPLVLLAQIRQAYNQFRFHYGGFAQIYSNLGRAAFCKRLEKYWLRWVWGRWEVMLHGSPATIVLGSGGGIKMAGGRPGKEIGDGEQRFLKGWVEKEKARGMVDMVAFRFGDYPEESKDVGAGKRGEGQGGYWFWGNSAKASVAAAMSTSAPHKRNPRGPMLVMPQDGCIFPSTGALETHSVGDISTYISELYQHDGDEASARSSGGRKQKKHRKRPKELFKPGSSSSAGGNGSAESPPRRSNSTIRPTREEPGASSAPPLAGSKLKSATSAIKVDAADGSSDTRERVAEVVAEVPSKSKSSSNTNAKILNLLTFGWSGGSTKSSQIKNDQTESTSAAAAPSSEPEATPPPMVNVEPMAEPVDEPEDSRIAHTELDDNIKNKRARFTIGFLGDLYTDDLDGDLEDEHSSGRITSRTVWAERRKQTENDNPSKHLAVVDGSGHGNRRNSEAPTIKQSSVNLEEFKIVVYTNHPLIFAFVFETSAPQLTSPAFYRTLHHQLSPLYTPLLNPSKLADTGPFKPTSPYHHHHHQYHHRPPYDLLYNPSTHTIHSTVPPIPESGSSPEFQNGWSRVDAFHIHTLILEILNETMRDRAECERSARSTKGWWINWMRLEGGEEGVVVRRAGEKKADLVAGVAGVGAGGVDIRKYFEGLVRGVR